MSEQERLDFLRAVVTPPDWPPFEDLVMDKKRGPVVPVYRAGGFAVATVGHYVALYLCEKWWDQAEWDRALATGALDRLRDFLVGEMTGINGVGEIGACMALDYWLANRALFARLEWKPSVSDIRFLLERVPR